MTTITYGSWEGTPTALVTDAGTGEMEGHVWSEKGRKWLPGFTSEAFSKAAAMTDEAFRAAFPDVPPFA